MKTQKADQEGDKKNNASADSASTGNYRHSLFQYADDRGDAGNTQDTSQLKGISISDAHSAQLQSIADNSPQVQYAAQLQSIANNSPQAQQAAQLQSIADGTSQQQEAPKKKNETGLPDELKTNIESLSGISLEDVKVHYNSKKPASLGAHAYAQGKDIYIDSGQEKHLPHEAWHIVQQKQGRVKPTTQLEDGVNINDDQGLEKEADVMGAKAMGKVKESSSKKDKVTSSSDTVQRAFIIDGTPITGQELKKWIKNYIGKGKKPEITAVINSWDADAGFNDDFANFEEALARADEEVKAALPESNELVGEQIGLNNPPNQVRWTDHPFWCSWYFGGLAYQDNKTGGWHSNRASLLPGNATPDGEPTNYVEFRRPGAIGTKEVNKMERCIFDIYTGRCFPNAHYDGGYVEITDIPNSVKARLYNIAFVATGMKELFDSKDEQEQNALGNRTAKSRALITELHNIYKDEEALLAQQREDENRRRAEAEQNNE